MSRRVAQEASAAAAVPETYSAAADNKAAPWSSSNDGVQPKTGKFSKEESELVRQAVDEFCAAKQISVARLCSECDHRAELKGAWMEIAKRLPHRTVQSVYRHGLRQLHPFKRGAWTDEECETLVQLVQKMGKKWAGIQQKLNRSADSCRDKYREMNDDYIKGRWKDHETEFLKRLVREHLNADPTADIKTLSKMMEQEGVTVQWSAISKRMGKRSRLSCFKKWQKLTGATYPMNAPESGYVNKLSVGTVLPPGAGIPKPNDANRAMDTMLLTELASLGVNRASEVAWNTLTTEHAQARWEELEAEWNADKDDNLLALPLSEKAQAILEETTSHSAQRAAETVEAVDLPGPESLKASV